VSDERRFHEDPAAAVIGRGSGRDIVESSVGGGTFKKKNS